MCTKNPSENWIKTTYGGLKSLGSEEWQTGYLNHYHGEINL
jgi:hypothetical protein